MGRKQTCCSTSVVQGLKPVLMMLVVQTAYPGMNIFYKLVAEVGMSLTVLVAYLNMFSAALMLPLALICERFINHDLSLSLSIFPPFSYLMIVVLN